MTIIDEIIWFTLWFIFGVIVYSLLMGLVLLVRILLDDDF